MTKRVEKAPKAQVLLKSAKKAVLKPAKVATQRLVLNPDDSKKLLAKHGKIRDRLRDILSKSTIRYDMQMSNKRPNVQLNIGKRTLMMLQRSQPRRPQGIHAIADRPVNRFYLSVLLMLMIVGASGFYTYKLTEKFYDSMTRTVAENVDWQGWVVNVSGKKTAFNREARRSFAEMQAEMRLAAREKVRVKRSGPREAAKDGGSVASRIKKKLDLSILGIKAQPKPKKDVKKTTRSSVNSIKNTPSKPVQPPKAKTKHSVKPPKFDPRQAMKNMETRKPDIQSTSWKK